MNSIILFSTNSIISVVSSLDFFLFILYKLDNSSRIYTLSGLGLNWLRNTFIQGFDMNIIIRLFMKLKDFINGNRGMSSALIRSSYSMLFCSLLRFPFWHNSYFYTTRSYMQDCPLKCTICLPSYVSPMYIAFCISPFNGYFISSPMLIQFIF